jgi:hypothetical protein
MREALTAAAGHALDVRGTVMLEAEDGPWCAICASAAGDLELRVGEPRRRKHRRWLEEHEFTHRVDAWTRPLWAGAGPGVAAETLATTLQQGLGLAPDTALRQILVQPGVAGGAGPPADAPHREHLAAVFAGLTGRAHIELGRPARPLAWVATDAGELVIEVQSSTDPNGDLVLGRYRDPRAAAETLTARLHGDFGYTDADPLFISLFDG